jgi:hypothetical protein
MKITIRVEESGRVVEEQWNSTIYNIMHLEKNVKVYAKEKIEEIIDRVSGDFKIN